MSEKKYSPIPNESSKDQIDKSKEKTECTTEEKFAKTLKETVESARNILKYNVYGLASGVVSLCYGAYLFGHTGFGATSMLCIGFGVAVSVWMMRNNYLTEREIGLSIDRSVSLNEKECILARLTDLPSWVGVLFLILFNILKHIFLCFHSIANFPREKRKKRRFLNAYKYICIKNSMYLIYKLYFVYNKYYIST